MPVIKILKDGRELASIIVPEEFEIRIVQTSLQAPSLTAPVQQPVTPPTRTTELTAAIPPVPAESPRVAATEQARSEPRKSDETKEIGEVMKEAIVRAEETSRKLVEAVEKEKEKKEEKKEDISLIRKVVEELIS